MEDVVRQKHEEGMFQRKELPGRFTAKKLYGWSDKRYDQEYWRRIEKNWRRWKGKKPMKRETMKMILEEEEIEEEKSGVREWTEEDDDVTLLENFLWKCSMGYTLYPWISLLEPTLETSYKPQT